MDAFKLSQVQQELLETLLEADAHQRKEGNDVQFRTLLKQARSHHERFSGVLKDRPDLATERRCRLRDATGTVITQLEALAQMSDA